MCALACLPIAAFVALCVCVWQAMAAGARREEPTMRVLRLTMTLLCFIMIALSGISWYRGAVVVEYTDRQAVAIHDMGHRMYYVEVCKVFFCRVHVPWEVSAAPSSSLGT